MTTPTEEALRVIGLCERATPGEWVETIGGHVKQLGGVVVVHNNPMRGEQAEDNAAAIVALMNFARTHLPDLLAENERLNAALRYEQHRAERVGTHGRDCWSWGPAHYECAVREVEALRADRDREADNATAALALLSRMRFACGDNGTRMQDELEVYLRGLREDAERYRFIAADHSAAWEAELDAAMAGGE